MMAEPNHRDHTCQDEWLPTTLSVDQGILAAKSHVYAETADVVASRGKLEQGGRALLTTGPAALRSQGARFTQWWMS